MGAITTFTKGNSTTSYLMDQRWSIARGAMEQLDGVQAGSTIDSRLVFLWKALMPRSNAEIAIKKSASMNRTLFAIDLFHFDVKIVMSSSRRHDHDVYEI